MLRRVSMCIFCALFVTGAPFAADAADKTWTAAVSGNYATAGNWTLVGPGGIRTNASNFLD